MVAVLDFLERLAPFCPSQRLALDPQPRLATIAPIVLSDPRSKRSTWLTWSMG